ncbi:class I SAM-dependent methyltransferase [Streptomyces castrisilvae]|uniref:Class I SAM-dependent methyltransferase n=1 Tax=Streptomyces castrisilvae TaxID=3033811 RepID=A0ABY9HM42_9ACTN|nr:class I SAM-dependent methyltransferase [Streptomyces sp. Mut1]WLQ35597.1 class I SAM-dependent methyltransferase [Streptomyces sp. Mut1]
MEVVEAWERYAQGRMPRRETNASGAATWLNWTQYPDHGPDESILGELRGRTVLELGCGTGCNLAHLTTLGADCTGVDIAPSQRGKAVARWGRLPGLAFHTAEVTDYLTHTEGSFDVVLSIFGPVWFTDPEQLLPLIHKRLSPGGVLAFSHKPPTAGTRPVGTLREARAVTRWDYSPEEWSRLLASSGYSNLKAEVIPPPGGEDAGTLLVRAYAY